MPRSFIRRRGSLSRRSSERLPMWFWLSHECRAALNNTELLGTLARMRAFPSTNCETDTLRFGRAGDTFESTGSASSLASHSRCVTGPEPSTNEKVMCPCLSGRQICSNARPIIRHAIPCQPPVLVGIVSLDHMSHSMPSFEHGQSNRSNSGAPHGARARPLQPHPRHCNRLISQARICRDVARSDRCCVGRIVEHAVSDIQ